MPTIGATEIAIILIIFFLLFGAEKLPKLARSMGQAKGEFHAGLNDVTSLPDTQETARDLEAEGRTPEQDLAKRAKDAGIDPIGQDAESVKQQLEKNE